MGAGDFVNDDGTKPKHNFLKGETVGTFVQDSKPQGMGGVLGDDEGRNLKGTIFGRGKRPTDPDAAEIWDAMVADDLGGMHL